MRTPFKHQVFALEPRVLLKQIVARYEMGIVPVGDARGQVGHPVYRGRGHVQHRAGGLECIETKVSGDQGDDGKHRQQQAQAERGLLDE